VHEVISSARESGRIVDVVSNNSPRAINAYLDRHSLSDGIRLVVARTSHDPVLLKPSPHLIDKAVRGLDANPAATALVGDSLTHIEATHSAAVASIGYANKSGKLERMIQLRAGAVVSRYNVVAPRAHRQPKIVRISMRASTRGDNSQESSPAELIDSFDYTLHSRWLVFGIDHLV